MGTSEIFFIFIIYLLLFGAKGIPSLAQGLGKAIRQFKDATGDIQREIMDGANDIKAEIKKNIEDPVKKSIQNPIKNSVQEPFETLKDPLKKNTKDINPE